MALRDIALTVREVAPGEFIWLLLDGAGARGRVFSYELQQSSPSRYASHSSALAAGEPGVGIRRMTKNCWPMVQRLVVVQ